MIKRILILSVVIVVIISLMIIPVAAQVVNYNDYVSRVSVDGDNDIVTVSMPVENIYFGLFNEDTGQWVKEVSGTNHFDFTIEPGYKYTIRILPNPSVTIATKDIPDNTEVIFDLDFSGPGDSYGTPTYTYSTRYFNEYPNVLYWHTYSIEEDIIGNQFPFATMLDIPTGAKSFDFMIDIQGFRTVLDVPQSYSFTVKSYEFQMTINSLYRQQMLTGQTNDILNAVEDQLEQNGQKLDDIINGQVNPEAPEGSGAVDDLDEVESGLRDDAQVGLDDGVQLQQSALEVVFSYLAAFNAIGLIFNLFADLPFFSALLAVSLSLGIFGLLVNLGNQLARHGSTKAHKEGKTKSGKGG